MRAYATILLLLPLLGCQGDPGAPGRDGQDGAPGEPGQQGPPGEPGQTPDAGPQPDLGEPDLDEPDLDVPDLDEPDMEPPLPCPDWTPPPGLGGAIDARVDLETAQRWLDYRAARERERLEEALDPKAVIARYRVEQDLIDRGCVSTTQAIDLGRALFLRPFTLEEGLGNDLANIPGTSAGDKARPNMRRFHKGYFGGPDATSCLNCHWKGGFAGGGDRADNTFFLGDGEVETNHDIRNPPALWGVGWAELVAQEMTADLQQQAARLREQVLTNNVEASVQLQSKGVPFGVLRGEPGPNGGVTLDAAGVEGVDPDLVIKPFGWKGNFASMREFLNHSLQVHMNLQTEELIAQAKDHPTERDDLGGGPDPDDPDNDGVTRELTEGQLTSIILFLATLDVPTLQAPTEAPLLEGGYSRDFEVVNGEEFTFRWLEGAQVFTEIGCAGCHTPLMPVSSSVYRTVAPLSGSVTEIDLAVYGAAPRPTREGEQWLVPVFSDFKRHRMGSHLTGPGDDFGVAADTWMTRRLWGASNSRPWMHDGSAALFDEAIAMHGGDGSEAQPQARAYEALSPGQKSSLRIFLHALRRAPSIRVR
jgi:mono/diheme cytochrome c family protein